MTKIKLYALGASKTLESNKSLRIMTLGKWMILIGGILLATGLISALRSNRDESRAMGEKARMGIIAFAPEVDSAEYKERRSIYHTL